MGQTVFETYSWKNKSKNGFPEGWGFPGVVSPQSNTLSVKKRNRIAESRQPGKQLRFSAPLGRHGGGRPRPAGHQRGPHPAKAWVWPGKQPLSKGRALKDPLRLTSLCIRFSVA